MKTMLDDHSQTVAQTAKMLLKCKEELRTWDAVAKRYGLSKPLVWRVATQNYEPKKPLIRHRLGLPTYAPAPVCWRCGEVHVTRRCTRRNHDYRSLWDMPVEELRRRLEEREEL